MGDEVGNEEITKDFIEKVLGRKYKEIDLSKNTTILPEDIEGKTSVLDVRAEAKGEAEEIINSKMQVVKYEYMAERMMYCWTSAYSEMLT